MNTLTIVERNGDHIRYIVQDEKGVVVANVDGDFSEEIKEARARKVRIEKVLAKRHEATQPIADFDPVVIPASPDLPKPAEPHTHEEFYHDHRDDYDALKSYINAELDDTRTRIRSWQQEVQNEIAKLTHLIGQHAEDVNQLRLDTEALYRDVAKKAEKEHVHRAYDDAIAHAQEQAVHVGLDVARLNERVYSIDAAPRDHAHSGVAYEDETSKRITELANAQKLLAEQVGQIKARLDSEIRRVTMEPAADHDHVWATLRPDGIHCNICDVLKET